MKKKKFSILNLFLSIILTISTLYLAYSIYKLKGIENLIRFIIIGILILFMVLTNIIINKKTKKKKKSKFLIIFVIIYSIILFVIGYYINKTYNIVSNITTNYTTYSSSLVTMSTNKVDSVENLGSGAIGMIDEVSNNVGYIIPKSVIKNYKLKNEVKLYTSYIEIIDALYKEEIKYAFLPSNYTIMFNNLEEEKYQNIAEETKIILTQEKKEEAKLTNKNLINEPFTILIMGADSSGENIKKSAFNGDSLILLTFNPKTLNATMLSIPRDTYVPIACFSNKRKNKITHAAWQGESCMMNTIENFTGIDIDYYVKINFKGVVKLVDTLGGVEVDVPYSFCEQNSDRKFGSHTVYVKEGLQTLNGEQALALARNRHSWPQHCSKEWTNYTSNDFIRGQNQQLIIKALLNKVKTVDSIDTLYKLLDTISNSLETNMSTNEILSLYNVAKDILIKSQNEESTDIINIQRLYLSGYSAMIYDYSMFNNQGSKMVLYNFVPYNGSINDITEAMKVNLGLSKPKIIKKASFSVDEPYEEKIIGKGYYSESSLSLLPDFVGKDISNAQSYCNSNNIKLNIVYKSASPTDGYKVGQILEQSVHSKLDLTYLNKNVGITFTVVDKITNTTLENTEPPVAGDNTELPNTNVENQENQNNTENNTNNNEQNGNTNPENNTNNNEQNGNTNPENNTNNNEQNSNTTPEGSTNNNNNSESNTNNNNNTGSNNNGNENTSTESTTPTTPSEPNNQGQSTNTSSNE